MPHRTTTAAVVVLSALAVPAAIAQEYPIPESSPPAAAPLPPLEPIPALRRAVVIDEVRGRVTYRLPGQRRERSLNRPTSVPVRTVVDASAGRVRLTVEADERGNTDTGVFFDGRFRVSQGGGDRPITHLRLVGPLPSCSSRASAAGTRRKKRRRLWGDGRGRFRTRGRYSAATVRGTKWLVEDRCDGTLTRVSRGEVEVIDYAPAPPQQDAAGPESGGGGQSPAAAPQRGSGPRRVRVRRGGTYVARPG